MIPYINRILQPEQLRAVLQTLFANRPVQILRTIAKTGKYNQSVPWVYYECKLTGSRRATFISFENLLQGFWAWLECTNLMLLATFAKQAVKCAIWAALPLGTWVYSSNLGKSQLVEKDFSKKTGQLRLWLRNQGTTQAIDPLEISSLQFGYNQARFPLSPFITAEPIR